MKENFISVLVRRGIRTEVNLFRSRRELSGLFKSKVEKCISKKRIGLSFKD